jgi:3-dehydroquinate synthetase
VGYGILFAAEVSKELALLDSSDVNLLYDVVHRTGALPSLMGVDESELLNAFRFDKKNIAGSLQMILLKDIGRPVVVTDTDIPPAALRKALKRLLKTHA